MPTQVAPALPAPGNAAEPPQVSTEALSTEALSTEALESELVGLAGHLAAGHCRWLLLLAEFDTREAWAGPGLRSCAHWLSWRVGMSVRTGLEQLRVAHALARLPAVTEAFAAGRVSYSKVRAITRVATPSTEVVLLDLALGGTATHVERVVRLTRQATADPVAAARRELSWRWDDDGTLVLRGRFPAEQGALLVAAITSVTGGPGSPEACTCAGDGGTDDGRRSRPAGRGEAVGGGSVEGPAGHEDVCAGEPIAARRADALVTLAGGGRQVQPQVVVVLDAGSDSGEVPNEGPAARAGCSTGRGSARIQRGPALPMRTAERVGCNARVRALLRDRRGNPLYLGRTRRLASPTQLTALQVRDQGRCQFPGCDQTRHLEAHHIVHWLRGGRTDLDNLVLICGRHHRLIHDLGFRIRGRGTELTFHRPDGRTIPPAGTPMSGTLDELITGHVGGRIDDDTITPTWAGERLDLSGILADLLPEEAWLAAA
ncbi:MAG TPA: DUF222 domain-containing protein [Pseudonocardia sp.]|nr:DUF222 domain-containing protein [Pseudonocardia sp.]